MRTRAGPDPTDDAVGRPRPCEQRAALLQRDVGSAHTARRPPAHPGRLATDPEPTFPSGAFQVLSLSRMASAPAPHPPSRGDMRPAWKQGLGDPDTQRGKDAPSTSAYGSPVIQPPPPSPACHPMLGAQLKRAGMEAETPRGWANSVLSASETEGANVEKAIITQRRLGQGARREVPSLKAGRTQAREAWAPGGDLERGAEGCFLAWKSCCWGDRPGEGLLVTWPSPPCPTKRSSLPRLTHTHTQGHTRMPAEPGCAPVPAPSRRLPWALVTLEGLSLQEVTGEGRPSVSLSLGSWLAGRLTLHTLGTGPVPVRGQCTRVVRAEA